MPAQSKSQQRLFGMVHAYQKGQMKKAPSKIKNVAKHISPTDATHFAATKTSKLPEHVKAAFDLGFFKTALDNGVEPLLAAELIKLL